MTKPAPRSESGGSGGSASGRGPKRQRRSFPRGGPTKPQKKKLYEQLVRMRRAVLQSNQDLADEALKESGQDFSVDHMADHGSDNFEQDFTLVLLQGETALLKDIEAALVKLDGEHELPFGLCENCAEEDTTWKASGPTPWIPVGRLVVVPYARLCVRHQEEQEEE